MVTVMLLPFWAKMYMSFMGSPLELPHTPGALFTATDTPISVPSESLSLSSLPLATSFIPGVNFGS